MNIDHRAKPLSSMGSGPLEQLIGYGENSLKIRNIPVHGGTITVNGSGIAIGSRVFVMGASVPVDGNGRFATQKILPSGRHVVDVRVVGKNGTLDFYRNLYIPDQDWFYIGIADLVAGENDTSGPAELVTSDTRHYDNEIYVDGRLAFYLKGKIKGKWLLTAAADTQEQPLGTLFSNFDAKDPRYLLRRLDPDRYYPVYGDDATAIEDAPTRGKFYVKLKRGASHVMWGNFKTRWTGSDFANFNRGMYGASAHLQTEKQTGFGEKRAELDLFAGDPGTLGARDDFRGTGGSLYYLRHLDITSGSERVWVEVRYTDSGIVLKTRPLSAGVDYEINTIQGRLMLTSPLPSISDNSSLVRAGTLSGHPVFLTATYEYTPGISKIENMTLGGRATAWLTEYLQIGASGYQQGDDAMEQTLTEADITLRYAPGTYIKGEVAHSDGMGSGMNHSLTGGFDFNPLSSPDEKAMAQRVEAAVDFSEISERKGDIRLYFQGRQKGFSAPGQLTNQDIQQYGGAFDMVMTPSLRVETKADRQDAESEDTLSASISGHYAFSKRWMLSPGVRYDDRDIRSKNGSPTLSENGSRTDGVLQLAYTPASSADNPDWSAYGFGQGTLNRTGDRDKNDRFGIGGRYKVSDPLNVKGEVSTGTDGLSVKAGGEWRVNERSQLYINYTLDSDRSDDHSRSRMGRLTTGGKTRYSDSLSVYAEERFQHGDGPSGLIHAFGLDLAASDHWNFGFGAEHGTLSDNDAEDLERTALSLTAGFAQKKTRYASNIEWREDDGTTSGERITWLMRNSIGYQTAPDWRFIGKLNFSFSESEKGDTYDADFIEGSLGYAFRPVTSDKLNALLKYTYFYDLPSPDALTASGSMADYSQQSHVFAIDGIYDLTPWLSVGGKYGFRQSQLKDNRIDQGPWFNSEAHLGIVKTTLHFVHQWDALFEGRVLTISEAKDQRAGMLVGVYRHMSKHIKLGVGYNFTDFSDDLTDLDYDSRGWFVNLVGKF